MRQFPKFSTVSFQVLQSTIVDIWMRAEHMLTCTKFSSFLQPARASGGTDRYEKYIAQCTDTYGAKTQIWGFAIFAQSTNRHLSKVSDGHTPQTLTPTKFSRYLQVIR